MSSLVLSRLDYGNATLAEFIVAAVGPELDGATRVLFVEV